MRAILTLVCFALALLGTASAEAASCSTFAVIKGYDAGAKAVTLEVVKGKERKFFPKTEGATATSKIPKKCSKKILKQDSFGVTPTGGRMSVTQVRSNFEGKMLNNTDEGAWLPGELKKLIDSGETIVAVLRPPVGKKKPYGLTTIYLPITQPELDEIERLNKQAEDV